jgi:membrane-associated phospholipid phosphatase
MENFFKLNNYFLINKMKMKFLPILLLLFFNGNAQQNDTVSSIKIHNKLSYKQFIAPAALITSGFLLKNTVLNLNLQKDIRNTTGTNFKSNVDGFLLFAPIAQIYGGNYLGFKSKTDFKHQTLNITISNLITYGIVFSMKRTFKEERPDLSDNESFPSGHTALAFTNASLLYYEYKDSNIWYASSGFLFASATGFLRIANNKHYTSDVLSGAGIGLGVGLAISYWNPFQSITFGKNKTHAVLYPQIGNQYGIGLLIRN